MALLFFLAFALGLAAGLYLLLDRALGGFRDWLDRR